MLKYEEKDMNEVAMLVNTLSLSNTDNFGNSNKLNRILAILNSGVILKEVEIDENVSK